MRLGIRTLAAAAAAFAAAACGGDESAQAPAAGAAPSSPPAYRTTPVAEGLATPWSLAFLPDGAMLVTERAGRLRVIRDGKLEPEPVAGVPPVYAEGQGGLFDVALHPGFASNGLVFLSYANGTSDANATRVARARFDGRSLQDLQVIFEASPKKNTTAHFGGRLLFLPDGTLLVTDLVARSTQLRAPWQPVLQPLHRPRAGQEVIHQPAQGRIPHRDQLRKRALVRPRRS